MRYGLRSRKPPQPFLAKPAPRMPKAMQTVTENIALSVFSYSAVGMEPGSKVVLQPITDEATVFLILSACSVQHPRTYFDIMRNYSVQHHMSERLTSWLGEFVSSGSDNPLQFLVDNPVLCADVLQSMNVSSSSFPHFAVMPVTAEQAIVMLDLYFQHWRASEIEGAIDLHIQTVACEELMTETLRVLLTEASTRKSELLRSAMDFYLPMFVRTHGRHINSRSLRKTGYIEVHSITEWFDRYGPEGSGYDDETLPILEAAMLEHGGVCPFNFWEDMQHVLPVPPDTTVQRVVEALMPCCLDITVKQFRDEFLPRLLELNDPELLILQAAVQQGYRDGTDASLEDYLSALM